MSRHNRVATNQAPPLGDHNVIASDLALEAALLRHGSPEVVADLLPLGELAGTAEALVQHAPAEVSDAFCTTPVVEE